MGGVSIIRNPGAYLLDAIILDPNLISASSTSNGDPQNGVAFDRLATRRLAIGGKVSVVARGRSWTTALARAGSLSLKLQDAASSGGPFTDYSTGEQPANVAVGSTTTSTGAANTDPTAVITHNVNLSGARRWVRAVVTPTLAATSSGADTMAYAGVLELMAMDELPWSTS